jgi:exonuclease III
VAENSLYTCYANLTDLGDLKVIYPSYMKIFHLNIRSLNKNHDALITLLASQGIQFDIIVLSELWIYNLEYYRNILPGYNFHYNINLNNHSSGVGIFILDRSNYSVDSTIEIEGCEVLKVTIKALKEKAEDFVLHCIYRHPGQLRDHFLENLENCIESCHSNCKQVIIGDLNINTLDCNSQSREYLDLLSKYCFLPLILTPT